MMGLLPPQTPDLAANASTQPRAWYQNVLDSAAQYGAQYLVLKQQKDIMDIQTQRLAQGLPPLDVSQYAPGVQVGVDSSTKNMLLIGGIVFAAVLLLRPR